MGVDGGSTNRWRSARERDRLRARHVIRSRVASRVVGDLDPPSSGRHRFDDDSCGEAGGISDLSVQERTAARGEAEASLQDMNVILRHLQAVITRDTSAFSQVKLAAVGRLLNRPLPTPSVVVDGCDFSNADSGGDCDIFDSSKGISTGDASSLGEAYRVLSKMLSTALPWRENRDGNAAAPSSTDAPQSSRVELYQPATLATSKFGRDYVANRLVPYMRGLRSQSCCGGRELTLLEYASLLGRHGICHLLLLGGIDPTIGCGNNGDSDTTHTEIASRKILGLFHSVGQRTRPVIPPSAWCYIVRSVIDMRMNGVLDDNMIDDPERTTACGLCNREANLIRFGPPCRHAFCEPCMWMHVATDVPSCMDLDRNLVTCPVCSEEFRGFQCIPGSCSKDSNAQNAISREEITLREEKKDGGDILPIIDPKLRDSQVENGVSSIESRERRRSASLAKYMALPLTSAEVREGSKRRKKSNQVRDSIQSTWGEALRPLVHGQKSQEVRSDRFFRAVHSSPHLVIGMLEAGIDVNIQNEYGQTPLYVACWTGPPVIVQTLLEYGADVSLTANGGSSCFSVAREHRRHDILCLLEQYSYVAATIDRYDFTTKCDTTCDYQVSKLIDQAADHPGAGACIVDNAISESQIKSLVELWHTLPVADACDDPNHAPQSRHMKEKSTSRPSRSYFCDAEGQIQTMLEGCVQAARRALIQDDTCYDSFAPRNLSSNQYPPESVLPHVRFLNYSEKGGILPPHVDLCRVVESGLRSTHTFILYLTDCERGGGTALLKSLKDPTVLATAEPRRGRALMFPHLCPHSGLEVESAPKLLLRGEVIMQ